MRPHYHQAQALLVDVQERLVPHIHDHEALLGRITVLLQGLLRLQIPIMVTEQYSKGLGPTVAPLQAVLGEHYRPIEKLSFSVLGSTQAHGTIMAQARHTVIVAGVEAHVCVLQTVLDLLAEGNTVVVVDDAVGSRRERDRQVAIERMRTSGAIVTTVESLLFEALVTAEAEAFKDISRLVK